MGRNLGPLNIKDSYEGLVQISGSQLTDGSGSLISNLEVTASHATTADASISASYAQTSTSASHALIADVALNVPATASYALYAEVAGFATSSLSASYALTSTSASHALVADLSTTASYVESVVSASYAVSSSHSDISDFAFTATSASYATTATLALSASHANNSDTATSSSHAVSSDSSLTSISASHAVISDTSISSSYSTFSETSVSSSHAISSDTAISASYAVTASYAENALIPNLQQVLTAGDSGTVGQIIILSGSNNDQRNYKSETITSAYANVPFSIQAGTTTSTLTLSGNDDLATNSIKLNSSYGTQISGSINTTGSLNVIGPIISGDGTNTVGTNGNEAAIGGRNNAVTGNVAGAFGGEAHTVSGFRAGAFGGEQLSVTGTNSFAMGGYNNTANSSYDGVVGGTANVSAGPSAVVVGGTNNSAQNSGAVIAGGNANQTNSGRSFIGGGQNNVMSAINTENGGILGTIAGTMTGNFHNANVILGGNSQTIQGSGNVYRTENNAILAGNNNYLGSTQNDSGSSASIIAGGKYNTINAALGPDFNLSSSAIIGGENNLLIHGKSIILGGSNITSSANNTVYVPNLNISGSLTDSDGNIGTAGQVLSSNGVDKVQWAAGGGGGAAFPYTGSADISGSLNVSGSITGVLQAFENIDIKYQAVANSEAPNILIGYADGAFGASGVNNILLGSSQNAALSSTNRYIGVTGTNYSNAIIGGSSNWISGSAGSRITNTILGGSGNAIGKNDWAVTISTNIIAGGSFHDIFAGTNNFLGGGTASNIYTGSLDTTPGYNGFLGGGSHDINGGDYNAFVGGYNSAINDAKQSVIVGGENHTITQTGTFADFDSVIVGGRNNTITDHARSVVLGGDSLSSSKADEVTVPHLTISGSVTAGVYTLTDVAGTTTMDCSLGNFFTLAMPAGGSTTLTPSNIQAGQTINVKITQNATPSTIAFAASVDFEGGTAFAVSTGAGEVDVMTFVSFDGTSLQATGLKNFS